MAGSVTLNGGVTLSGAAARAITAGTTVDVNGDISGAQDLTVAGTTVFLSTVGESGADPTLLDVNATTLNLEGDDLTVDGSVRLDGAATTTLSADVTIDTTGGADNTIVDFAVLNGNRSLTIAGGDADVDFNGAVTELTGLSVTGSDSVTVDGNIDVPGAVLLTASELVDVNAPVGATTAADSVTVNGATNLGGNVTAVNDITLNDTVTLSGANRTITSNEGSIDLNAVVNATTDSTEGLTLSALNGTVFAIGLGTGTRLGALDIDALAAELGGDITATGVDTTGVGLTTLTADVKVDGTGAIALGDIDGARSLDIDAGTTVALAELDIDSLTVDRGTTVTFAGAVSALGSVQVGETTAPTGIVTIDASIDAQGDVDLSSDASIDINANVSGETVDVNSAATVGDVGETVTVSGEEDVAFDAAVTLEDGSVAVSSANGSVTFSGNIDGSEDLSVNADGTVTIGGIVGGTAGLDDLDITAGTLIDVNAAVADADSIVFNGASDLGADLTATLAGITLNGQVTLSGAARTLTGNTTVDVNGDVSGAQDLTVVAPVVFLSTAGESGANPTELDVDATTLNLEGDLTVDGNVEFDGATTTTLLADVTIDTTGGADGTDVIFSALNGNRTLTIAGGDADVDFNGAVTELTGLSVTGSDSVTVNGNIDVPGAVLLTASEVVDVNAPVGAATAAASVTVNGATNLGADVTAVNDITLNDAVTLSGGGRTVTSNEGDVDLNATVDATTASTEGLTLNALNGTVFAEGLGTGTRLGALDVNALAAGLAGNIRAVSVDTTGVGLTTLTAVTIDIDTVGGGVVNLGSLIGNNLTISAGGAVSLDDAAIVSLVIDDATGVTLDGDVETSGVTTINTDIDGAITISATGSVNAGGDITLDTDAGGDINIGGTVTAADGSNVTVSADDDVIVDADVSASGGTVAITANGGLVRINNPANIAGTEVTVTAVGATADIDINTLALFNDEGSYSFISGDTITLDTGDQSIIALTDILFDATSLVLAGAADSTFEIISGEGSIDIAANVTDTSDGQILELSAGLDVLIEQLTLDNDGSSIVAEAFLGVVFEDNPHLVDGDIVAFGDEFVFVDGPLTTVNGDIDLESFSEVIISADLNSGSDIFLAATNFILIDGALTADESIIAISDVDIIFNGAVTAGTFVDLFAVEDIIIDFATPVTAGDGIFMDAGREIDVDELNAGTVVVLTAGASVRTTGPVTAGTDVFMGAGVDIDTLAITAGENVELDAGRDVDTDGAVDAGVDIMVTAGNDSETAALTAGEDIAITAGNDATLGGASSAGTDASLTAGNDIVVNAALDADNDDSGAGDLTATADRDSSGAGNLRVTTGTLSGENVNLSGHAIDAQAITADSDGDGDGDISIIGLGVITLDGPVTSGANSGIVQVITDKEIILADPITAGAGTGRVDMDAGGAITSSGLAAIVTAATVDLDAGGRIGGAGSRLWIDAPRVELDTTGEGSVIRAYIVNNNFDPDQVLVAGTSGNDASIDVVFDGIHDGTGIDIGTLTRGEDAHTVIVGMNGGVLNLNSLVTYNGDIEVTNDEDLNVISVLAQDVAGGTDGAPNTADDINGLFNDAHVVVLTTNNGTNVRIAGGGIRADADVIINSSGDILDLGDSDVTNITAGNGIFLNASDFIGEVIDPLEIDAGQEGVLTFTGTGDRRPIWAVLNGVIDGTGDPTNLEFGGIGRTPPGLIIYNGISTGGPLDLELQILRSESFDTESRIFTGGVSAIFSLSPQFFTHSIIINSFYYPAIPAIERINQGRVRVYGVPEGLDVPIDINILLEQDSPYSAGTEDKSKSNLGAGEKEKRRKAGPFTKKGTRKKSAPLTKKDKKLESSVKTSQVGYE